MKLILNLSFIFFCSCHIFNNKHERKNAVFLNEESKTSTDSDEILFLMEIQKGSFYKYEYRTASGARFLDRTICPQDIIGKKNKTSGFPVHYGISPSRFNIDGDPLDVVVLNAEEIYLDMIKKKKIVVRKVKMIGVLKMEECTEKICNSEKDWEQDWKVIGIDSGLNSDDFNFQEKQKQDLVDFFSSYKGYEFINNIAYPKTRVTGFLGRDEAIQWVSQNFPPFDQNKREKEIKKCQSLYKKIYDNKSEYTKGKQKKFLKCIERVDWVGFHPESPAYDFFKNYTAFQLLFKSNKIKQPSYKNAFAQMKELMEGGETYYRYVAWDRPSPPGTDEEIFSWIKTKKRSDECPLTKQHYDNSNIFQ